MEVSLYWIALTVGITMVAGVYDQAFCERHIGTGNSTDYAGVAPTFYDNFYVFIEKKTEAMKSVMYQDEYYCQAAKRAYGTFRELGNQTQAWIDATNNEIMESNFGSGMCLNKITTGFSSNRLLGVIVDDSGKVSLTAPGAALGWGSAVQAKYTGTSAQRGITTLVWKACSYNNVTQVTTASEWHFADSSMSPLRGDKNEVQVLPAVILVSSNDYPNQNTSNVNPDIRYDLTFFDHVKPDDDIFQIPTTKLCSAKPSAQVPLPKTPTYFKFKGEQITIDYYNTQNPHPADLLYTLEEYTLLSQIFVQDKITASNNQNTGNDKSFIRTVNDYNTGLSFQMNLESGSCLVGAISADDVDSIPAAGGYAQMRTTQQFFDLDSDQYQYMGIHKKRGIECDTWSAYFTDGLADHEQNSLYTWYFATANWMKSHKFSSSSPLPVSLEIQSILAYIQFNFYEFDTNDQMRLPDVSLCFDPKSTYNVEFFISASYSKVVSQDEIAFRRALYAAIVEFTGLVSVLRISELDVQPASGNTIVVRFKLLDISTVQSKGNASHYDAPNSLIYSNLNTAVNAGTFSLYISASSGVGTITATAKPDSVGQFEDGKFVGATKSSDTGYSAGAMAGIGIGMIVLGIILGVAILFAIKKYKKGASGTDFNMKKLSDESQT